MGLLKRLESIERRWVGLVEKPGQVRRCEREMDCIFGFALAAAAIFLLFYRRDRQTQRKGETGRVGVRKQGEGERWRR